MYYSNQLFYLVILTVTYFNENHYLLVLDIFKEIL